MSGSGKGLLGLWLYRSGEQEWAVKAGSPLHKPDERLVIINRSICLQWATDKFIFLYFSAAYSARGESEGGDGKDVVGR